MTTTRTQLSHDKCTHENTGYAREKCRAAHKRGEVTLDLKVWEAKVTSPLTDTRTEKRCPRCGEVKSVSEFHRRGNGYRSRCKSCQRESLREHQRNETRQEARREYGRNRGLRNRYGITLEQRDAMIAERCGRCDICGEVPDHTLHVEHDHDTGEVRGMSCNQCNRLLAGYEPVRALGLAHRIAEHLDPTNHTQPRPAHEMRGVRSKHLRARGITEADRDAMIERQGGVCRICQQAPTGRVGFHIDHCHETGMTRAALCNGCNAYLLPTWERLCALGIDPHQALEDYLTRDRSTLVPD
ncbi:endonuclease domain-containing protein [Bacillus safensis]|uniref:endonuclease domain-containing protein n=1 Tax=Bacillus safensis TaxID=561879 RepID=UPI00365D7300